MLLSRNNKDQLVVTFERELDPEALLLLSDYLRRLELTAGMKKVSKKQKGELADGITANRRRKNKERHPGTDRR